MKKLFFITAFSVIQINLFSQVYKLESVFSDKLAETYLSHWLPLDNINENHTDTFSLWGYQLYFDDWVDGAYEVEYFKGNTFETYNFLAEINLFSEKYQNEDKVLTYISGVKVKTFKALGFKFILVYDKEGKVPCSYKPKQWSDILSSFIDYCEKNKINYKQN